MSKEENLLKYAQLLDKAVVALENSLQRCSTLPINYELSLGDFEKYDALTTRFSRAIEVCLKYFKTFEIVYYGESSENIRTLLSKMEKNNLITSTDIFLETRLLRNKVTHDDIANTLIELNNNVISIYIPELIKTNNIIKNHSNIK